MQVCMKLLTYFTKSMRIAGKITCKSNFQTNMTCQYILLNDDSAFVFYLFSVKVLEKKHILREKKQEYVMREKEVFSKLNHPFFIKLYFTFQDPDRLCILFGLL